MPGVFEVGRCRFFVEGGKVWWWFEDVVAGFKLS